MGVGSALTTGVPSPTLGFLSRMAGFAGLRQSYCARRVGIATALNIGFSGRQRFHLLSHVSRPPQSVIQLLGRDGRLLAAHWMSPQTLPCVVPASEVERQVCSQGETNLSAWGVP